MNPNDVRVLLKLMVAAVGAWMGKVGAEALGLHGLLGSAAGARATAWSSLSAYRLAGNERAICGFPVTLATRLPASGE
jgi:hypothetical protein